MKFFLSNLCQFTFVHSYLPEVDDVCGPPLLVLVGVLDDVRVPGEEHPVGGLLQGDLVI